MKTHEAYKCHHCGKLHETERDSYVVFEGTIYNKKVNVCTSHKAGAVIFCKQGCLYSFLLNQEAILPNRKLNMFGQIIKGESK